MFDMGMKKPLDTRIWIQMTTSVFVDKYVSISMISVPTAAGIYYQFRLFSRNFLPFFLLFLSIILYIY